MAKKIAFDYESIKNRIEQKLSSMSEWATFLSFGPIDNIISAISNELCYDIQYGEYNTMENFWNLARNRSSLLQMSPMHGYIVPRRQGSVGTIRISASKDFNAPHSKNIDIPKFFQFSGNDLYVCSDGHYTLNSNENYIDIQCIQGEVKEMSFLAEGLKYEEKTVYDEYIENSFFTLTVNGVEWEYTDTLYSCSSEDKKFQLRTLPNLSGVTIRFGNDVFGKKLLKNDEVIFKYITTKGSQGNIFSSNIITSVKSQAFDSSGESVKLYCTNTTTFVGGKDYPSLEEIRDISPKVYQTGDRASSKTDFETILKQINYLSKVSVWGAYETLKDENQDPWGFIPSTENVVHLALLDSNGESLNNDKKSAIINTLHKICDPTNLFTFEKVNKVPMVFYIDASLNSLTYTTAEIESRIKTVLSNAYGFDKMNFGESVYESDYIRLIDEIQGIDNHITFIELYYEDYILSSAYYGMFELPIYPIDYSSVIVYVKDTSQPDSKHEELGRCDMNGNIVGSGIYITTDSVLNLNNGKGTIYVQNGLTSDYHNYLFKIVYRYVERNLINSSRSNILYYDNVVVELNYKP
jgi:hypothetical protein